MERRRQTPTSNTTTKLRGSQVKSVPTLALNIFRIELDIFGATYFHRKALIRMTQHPWHCKQSSRSKLMVISQIYRTIIYIKIFSLRSCYYAICIFPIWVMPIVRLLRCTALFVQGADRLKRKQQLEKDSVITRLNQGHPIQGQAKHSLNT